MPIRIVRATRDCPGIAVGAGPRGSIALIRIARAFALMNKRDFVTPADIKSACLPVLRHRVALSPESELDGLSSDTILSNMLEQIAAPRAQGVCMIPGRALPFLIAAARASLTGAVLCACAVAVLVDFGNRRYRQHP